MCIVRQKHSYKHIQETNKWNKPTPQITCMILIVTVYAVSSSKWWMMKEKVDLF